MCGSLAKRVSIAGLTSKPYDFIAPKLSENLCLWRAIISVSLCDGSISFISLDEQISKISEINLSSSS